MQRCTVYKSSLFACTCVYAYMFPHSIRVLSYVTYVSINYCRHVATFSGHVGFSVFT